MPSFMYGAVFVNLLLLILTIIWLIFKSPDFWLNIIIFLVFIYGTLTFLFSYPYYFYEIKKKHAHGLEKKVYRTSLKWGSLAAFFVTGLLGLRAFDLWTIINVLLFSALCSAIVMGMLKKM